MCGIAGVIGKHAVRRVRAMLPLMAHRGPDGEGVWSGNPCLALGHRRLAINDLSETGRQPMISPDGATVIVVNGEIYNYPDLRKELETLGAIFNSTSDSEIVLHAWRQWGIECFARFNGMFAIGLFDDTKNLLVLARDRLGIKPLYYRLGTQELVFASEIKGLLAGLEFTPDLDPVGLNQYLLYQNCFGDRSLREGVRLLRPGHILSCTPEGVSELRPFWSLKFGDSSVACDFETAVDRYRETLDAAVHRHLMSDVPVASYLSAGFDSATVATRASAYGSPPVCFTGCFSEGAGMMKLPRPPPWQHTMALDTSRCPSNRQTCHG